MRRYKNNPLFNIYRFITFIYRVCTQYSLCVIKVMQIWYLSFAASRYRKGIAKIYIQQYLLQKRTFSSLYCSFTDFLLHVIFVERFKIIFVQRPDERNRANLPSLLTRKYTSFAFSVKSDSYTNERIHVANRIKKALSSSKLAESLRANETAAVHLDAAEPFWKSCPPSFFLPLSFRPRRNNMDFLYPIGDVYFGVLREAQAFRI